MSLWQKIVGTAGSLLLLAWITLTYWLDAIKTAIDKLLQLFAG